MVDKATSEFADTEKMIDTAEKLWPVPLGPLRPVGAAAVVPVRRHGEPAPDLRHAHRDRRRQVAGVAGRARTGAQLVGQPGHLRHRQGRPLNEGTTTYVQSCITEAPYGKDMADMEEAIDRDELKQEFTISILLQRLSPAGRPGRSGQFRPAPPFTKGARFLQFPGTALRPRRVRSVAEGLLRPLRLPEHHHRAVPRLPAEEPDRQAPGQGDHGRSGRVAVRAGHPERRRWWSRQVQHRQRRAHRPVGQRAIAQPDGHRRMDHAGMGAFRGHADTLSPSSSSNLTRPGCSPAPPMARSRCAGIRWPNAAVMLTARGDGRVPERVGRRKLIIARCYPLVPRPAARPASRCSPRRSPVTT